MTDRIKGLLVTFDKPMREEAAERYVDTIRLLRGIASVTASVDRIDDHMCREIVRAEIKEKLVDAIDLIFDPKKEHP